jgi:hypothetical protein
MYERRQVRLIAVIYAPRRSTSGPSRFGHVHTVCVIVALLYYKGATCYEFFVDSMCVRY